MEFLKGVKIGPNLSVVYPSNEYVKKILRDSGMTLEEIKTHKDFQKIVNHMVTRCPNVYASRDQNAFLVIDRSRMISDFTNGYITDIERDERYPIVSNEMINGTRYIGIQGWLLPKELDIVFKKGGMETLTRDPRMALLKSMSPLDIINSCATDKEFAKLCNQTGVFETLMKIHHPKVKYSGNARHVFNILTKRKGMKFGFNIVTEKLSEKLHIPRVKDNKVYLISENNERPYRERIKLNITEYPKHLYILFFRDILNGGYFKGFSTRKELVDFAINKIRKNLKFLVRDWEKDFNFHKRYIDTHYNLNGDFEYQDYEDKVAEIVSEGAWQKGKESELLSNDNFDTWLKTNYYDKISEIFNGELNQQLMQQDEYFSPISSDWFIITKVDVIRE